MFGESSLPHLRQVGCLAATALVIFMVAAIYGLLYLATIHIAEP
jgi:hypothetical protein